MHDGSGGGLGKTGSVSETAVVEIEGHIIDSLILAKILDTIIESGADYRIVHIDVGRRQTDPSHARIEVVATDADSLEALLTDLHPHGAHPVTEPDARLVAADTDGVLPRGFYATTNLATSVKVGGHWLHAEPAEMDCALVVAGDRATTTPMHRVKAGDLVVVGAAGVRVKPLEKPRTPTAGMPDQFAFMTSEISSEKPKGLIVSQVADRIRSIKAGGGKLLAVCGPAVIHTGAGPDLARLVRE